MLESTRNTVTIQHGTNGTPEKTTVDTNPEKVLEHENLIAGTYLTKTSSGNTSTLKVSDDFVGIVNGKQNTINTNVSIGVNNNTLHQLYCWRETYTNPNGVLKTHVKYISYNTSVTTIQEEFNFILKINQGTQEATFTLNEHDKTSLSTIITNYGVDNTVRINGCLLTLSNDTLIVSTDSNTGNNCVITFSDII